MGKQRVNFKHTRGRVGEMEMNIILLVLILGIPIILFIAIHFISNAIGKKMRVVLHKENEPAVYVGDDDNHRVNPATGSLMIGNSHLDAGGDMWGCD